MKKKYDQTIRRVMTFDTHCISLRLSTREYPAYKVALIIHFVRVPRHRLPITSRSFILLFASLMAAFTGDGATTPPCVLCGAAVVGHGHNAAPMAEGTCCDACNLRVMAARIREHMAARIRDHLNTTMNPALVEVLESGQAAPELEEKFCAICQTHTNKGFVFPCCEGFVCWEDGNAEHQCALNFRMALGEKTKIVLHKDGTLEEVKPPACPYCRATIPSSNMTEKITAMLREKATRGDPLNQFAFAKYLLSEVNTPETLPEAHYWMEKSVAQNFPGAMHMKAQVFDTWVATPAKEYYKACKRMN